MKPKMDERCAQMGAHNARIYRIVKGADIVTSVADIVTSVPPRAFGFRHLVDPVVIGDDGNAGYYRWRW